MRKKDFSPEFILSKAEGARKDNCDTVSVGEEHPGLKVANETSQGQCCQPRGKRYASGEPQAYRRLPV